jgi:hypothetical protein
VLSSAITFFLDACNILKPLSFEGSFHLMKEQLQSRNWDCIDKSGCNLGTMRVSVASAYPWVCIGQPKCRSSFSINVHGGFGESPSYWCLIHLPTVWASESQPTISCHPFIDICDCVCMLRDSRTPASWIILKILMAVFKWLKQIRYTIMISGFIIIESWPRHSWSG